MRPSTPITRRRLLAAGALAATARPTFAQTPAPEAGGEKVSRSEEHMAFAQLVEFLHRDTFPPGAAGDPPAPLRASSQVKMFVEQRKKMIGYIQTRMRDMKAEPELSDLYDGYLGILTEAGRYGDALRRHEDEYVKG